MLNLVGDEHRSVHLACAVACRACFLDFDVDHRPNPLPCYLHKSKLAERQHVMSCPVVFHQVADIVVELLLMFGCVHVDEVDDDYAAHISQPELVHYFFGGGNVDVKRVLLLVDFVFVSGAAVYVNDVQRLGMVNDEVRPVFAAYCPSHA